MNFYSRRNLAMQYGVVSTRYETATAGKTAWRLFVFSISSHPSYRQTRDENVTVNFVLRRQTDKQTRRDLIIVGIGRKLDTSFKFLCEIYSCKGDIPHFRGKGSTVCKTGAHSYRTRYLCGSLEHLVPTY